MDGWMHKIHRTGKAPMWSCPQPHPLFPISKAPATPHISYAPPWGQHPLAERGPTPAPDNLEATCALPWGWLVGNWRPLEGENHLPHIPWAPMGARSQGCQLKHFLCVFCSFFNW